MRLSTSESNVASLEPTSSFRKTLAVLVLPAELPTLLSSSRKLRNGQCKPIFATKITADEKLTDSKATSME